MQSAAGFIDVRPGRVDTHAAQTGPWTRAASMIRAPSPHRFTRTQPIRVSRRQRRSRSRNEEHLDPERGNLRWCISEGDRVASGELQGRLLARVPLVQGTAHGRQRLLAEHENRRAAPVLKALGALAPRDGRQRDIVRQTIADFRENADRMHYTRYLAKGLPSPAPASSSPPAAWCGVCTASSPACARVWLASSPSSPCVHSAYRRASSGLISGRGQTKCAGPRIPRGGHGVQSLQSRKRGAVSVTSAARSVSVAPRSRWPSARGTVISNWPRGCVAAGASSR